MPPRLDRQCRLAHWCKARASASGMPGSMRQALLWVVAAEQSAASGREPKRGE